VEFRQLKSFVTIARSGSFTRAAELLDYAQSSVTTQVQTLESELGTRLFERLGRRVVLTSDGEKLLKYADQILKLSTEVKEIISGSAVPRGTLSIGAPESLCVYRLPELLQNYRKQYPEVELILRSGACPDFIRWLKEGFVDVALFLHRPVEMPELILKTVTNEIMVVLAGASHPLSGKGSVVPRDLEGDNLILTEFGCSYRSVFEAMLAEAGVRPASITEFGSVEAIKKAVISGLGVALLPRVAVEAELTTGLLTDLNWEGPEFNMVTEICYHKDKWLSPALEAFLGMAREMMVQSP